MPICKGLQGCRPLFPVFPKTVVPYMFPLWLDDAERVFFRLKRAGVPIFRWDELAVSDCEVLEVGVEAFRRVVLADPALVERVTGVVAARRAGLETHRAMRSAPAASPEAPHTLLARVRQFLRL